VAGLILKQLRKTFTAPDGSRKTAVRDVSLSMDTGEIVVLVGPSGCGKTTLLRLVAGLDAPDSGSVFLDGKEVTRTPAGERGVAMVFQDLALYPHLTARENMAFGLHARRLDRRENNRRVDAMAGLLDLDDCLDRIPAELSGGERQRVALGRALARNPGVLLLDEPFSSLDATLRAQLRAGLLRIQSETGVTVLHVTHDQAEAMALGRRLVVMNEGMTAQEGPACAVYDRPASTFVAGFLGAPPMNLLPCTIEQQDGNWLAMLETGQDIRPVLKTGSIVFKETASEARPVLLGIRPEHIHLEPPPPAQESSWEARVTGIEHLGHETLVRIKLGTMSLTARVPGKAGHQANDRVGLRMAMDKVVLFDRESGHAI
jgi:ABC-type sugar transport system ATPase subunit